tara:strand:- start:72 stop:497 length:426 start_codon:yes stop_codon:yes gene_type:complete
MIYSNFTAGMALVLGLAGTTFVFAESSASAENIAYISLLLICGAFIYGSLNFMWRAYKQEDIPDRLAYEIRIDMMNQSLELMRRKLRKIDQDGAFRDMIRRQIDFLQERVNVPQDNLKDWETAVKNMQDYLNTLDEVNNSI